MLFSSLSFSQVEDTAGYLDENKQYQGYWRLPEGFMGKESWGEGYYKDSKRIGTWQFVDEKGKLLGYRIYEEDGVSEIEIRLKNEKIRSIIRRRLTEFDEETRTGTAEIIEVIDFNKCGKLKKVYSLQSTPSGNSRDKSE